LQALVEVADRFDLHPIDPGRPLTITGIGRQDDLRIRRPVIELIRAGAICLGMDRTFGWRKAVEILPRLAVTVPFTLVAHPALRQDRRTGRGKH
jgi:hypothetical protein